MPRPGTSELRVPEICVGTWQRGSRLAVQTSTFEPAASREWGRCDAPFIDGKEVRAGPSPSYERIKGPIEKRKSDGGDPATR